LDEAGYGTSSRSPYDSRGVQCQEHQRLPHTAAKLPSPPERFRPSAITPSW
jgi:hypothetical protein